MLKKVYYGKIHRKQSDVDATLWYFYGLNTKIKKLKPQTRSKGSKRWSLLFFLLNLVVVGGILAYQLHKDGVDSIRHMFVGESNPIFIVAAVMCFVFAEICVGLRLAILSKKFNKKTNFPICLKSEFICQYYNRVTPFAFGGQPFQVYELNKAGIRANNAVTMVSCNYVAHKLTYWIVCLLAMITIGTNALLKQLSGPTFHVVLTLALVSLGFMSLFLTFVILVCVNKKIASRLVRFIIVILNKLRIIKNRKYWYFKIMRPALSFQHKMRIYFKSRCAFLTLILSFIECVFTASIPACIYFIFKPFSILAYWQLVSIAIFITLSFGVNPIPGGSGVAELSFSAVFAILIDRGLVFWALLLWRILTYYIYLVLGIGIVGYNYAIGNKKMRRKKKLIQNE